MTARHRRRLLRAALGVCIGLVLAWGAGLVWFVRVATGETEPPARADGIVVLTGGAERVETALRLLQEGRARLLLVSGTGGGAELPELSRLAGLDPAPLADRVTLGRAATTTHGNAMETASWARANHIRSLIVVTAGYHMPRALTELSRALPEATLYPAPVRPPALRGGGWAVRDLATLRLMAEEYSKWLAATAGLSEYPAPAEPRGGPA